MGMSFEEIAEACTRVTNDSELGWCVLMSFYIISIQVDWLEVV